MPIGGRRVRLLQEVGRLPFFELLRLASIQAALSEARGLDQGGKESECMDAITRAKRLAG